MPVSRSAQPVGASLLAIAECHSPLMSNDTPLSRANLPQVVHTLSKRRDSERRGARRSGGQGAIRRTCGMTQFGAAQGHGQVDDALHAMPSTTSSEVAWSERFSRCCSDGEVRMVQVSGGANRRWRVEPAIRGWLDTREDCDACKCLIQDIRCTPRPINPQPINTSITPRLKRSNAMPAARAISSEGQSSRPSKPLGQSTW